MVDPGQFTIERAIEHAQAAAKKRAAELRDQAAQGRRQWRRTSEHDVRGDAGYVSDRFVTEPLRDVILAGYNAYMRTFHEEQDRYLAEHRQGKKP